jgi:hypothetical protein
LGVSTTAGATAAGAADKQHNTDLSGFFAFIYSTLFQRSSRPVFTAECRALQGGARCLAAFFVRRTTMNRNNFYEYPPFSRNAGLRRNEVDEVVTIKTKVPREG